MEERKLLRFILRMKGLIDEVCLMAFGLYSLEFRGIMGDPIESPLNIERPR